MNDLSIKLLVHNVSHSDISVVVRPDNELSNSTQHELIARPASSRFKHVCKELLKAMNIYKFCGISLKDKKGTAHFIGIQFEECPKICSWSDFRFRDSDTVNNSQSNIVIVKVFYPLISIIIPKWLRLRYESQSDKIKNMTSPIVPKRLNFTDESSEGEHDNNNNSSNHIENKMQSVFFDCEEDGPKNDFYTDFKNNQQNDIVKIRSESSHKLFLVSGAGHPETNIKEYEENDSTQFSVDLMTKFLKRFYPEIDIQHFHSGSNIFYYKENVRFVHQELRPAIDKLRGMLAEKYNKDWPSYWHIAIALCTGSPARLSAIIEGLRSYTPDMLHVWQIKTLWNSYPKLTTLWENDIEYLTFHELETYPALKVSDTHNKMIENIVDEMKAWQQEFQNSIADPSSEFVKFWLRKTYQPVLAILMVEKDNKIKYFRGVNMEVSMPTGSLCAERNAIGTAMTCDPSLRRDHFKMIAVLALPELEKHDTNVTPYQNFDVSCQISNNSNSPNLPPESSPPLTESKKNLVFNSPALKEISVIGKNIKEDFNPRGPCGSCEEWLKKIAQSNPNFKVVTFADQNLNHVFVRNLN